MHCALALPPGAARDEGSLGKGHMHSIAASSASGLRVLHRQYTIPPASRNQLRATRILIFGSRSFGFTRPSNNQMTVLTTAHRRP